VFLHSVEYQLGFRFPWGAFQRDKKALLVCGQVAPTIQKRVVVFPSILSVSKPG